MSMPTQQLSFAHGEEPRVTLSWESYYKEFTVAVDGEEVGQIEGGMRELKKGRQFQLADGSELALQLQNSFLMEEIAVSRDGVPLPGSAAHPNTKLAMAYWATIGYGVIALILGAVAYFNQTELLLRYGFTVRSLLFGGLLLLSAMFMRKSVLLGAILAFIVFVVDWGNGLIATASTDLSPTSLSLLLRILIAGPLIQGIRTALKR